MSIALTAIVILAGIGLIALCLVDGYRIGRAIRACRQ